MAGDAAVAVRGLPFTRFYAFDEIGNVSAGARLAFDPHGRLAVVQQGALLVLNDTEWLDVAGRDPGDSEMQQVADGGDGHLYFGGLGSWGVVDTVASERWHTRSLVPKVHPKWIAVASFVEIAATRHGVFFGGLNGVVYWDRALDRCAFFEIAGMARLLVLGDRAFVYAPGQQIRFLDTAGGSLRAVDCSILAGASIDHAANLDRERVVLSTDDQRLLLFDGSRLAEWGNELGPSLRGRVTSLARLTDGGVAVAVSGQGLYFISAEGRVFWSLTDLEHRRVNDMATHEPGVLWLVTENGVEKVLYRSPVTAFGQRLGLPVSWPQVAGWNGRVVIASGGRLFETVPGSAGATARFQPVVGQPGGRVWGIAARGPRMLVGSTEGVFARAEDGSFSPVLPGVEVSRVVMTSPDFCYFIGPAQMGALRWQDGRWAECAERAPGIGPPAVVHAAGNSAWIELQGGNRVGRVSLEGGRLRTQVFEEFPWAESQWTNVSVIGNLVMLNGGPGKRLYFDENTGGFAAAPPLERVLNQAPVWIVRIQGDDEGTLWATHEQGVLVMRRVGDGYAVDAATLDMVNDRNLVIQMPAGGDVWFSNAFSLYSVDRASLPRRASPRRPILVAIAHGGSSQGMAAGERPALAALRFPYTEDSLGFRFFSGSYGSRRPPAYEFRLNQRPDAWASLGTGSLLVLPHLREGAYHIEVRLADDRGPRGDPVSIAFEIAPPWQRTGLAIALYALGATAAVGGALRWFVRRTTARNARLERLVQQRTGELRRAMARLNEETRNAATLAERDRLAGEIHDSVQQGLSGVMLQLDATLKLPAVAEEVRSRLGVARNMVSFTRQEIQHAVWDMESPLLAATELGEALRRIAELVGSGAARLEVAVTGAPVALSPAAKHHLLRIAQEAITNAVRHAAARTIRVQLAYDSAGLALSVTDDGCGFVPERVMVRGIGHFGLRGLRERAAKIGGALEIQSAVGAGTSIRVSVPAAVCQPRESDADTR